MAPVGQALAGTARRAPPQAIAASVVAAILFLSLALLVTLEATRGVDLAVIRAFQSIASYPIDLAVNAHTVVGQLAITLPLSVLIAAIVQRRLGGYAWLGPLFILATGGIELVLKYTTAHPGPPREFIRAFTNPLGLPPDWRPPYAFPSGHMARLTFLTVLLVSLFPSRWLVALGSAFVALSIFARVYIGDHWISDSLGGAALGISVGAAAIAWMRATARR